MKKMSHTITKVETSLFQQELTGYVSVKPDPLLTAGDIVDLLLKKGINAKVSWEDEGDVGMKERGFCKGSEFHYPPCYPWGGCHYNIEFAYEEVEYRIYAFEQSIRKADISLLLRFSTSNKFDSATILKLLEK